MTCKKCAYEFCWYCLQAFQNHDRSTCDIIIIVKVVLCLCLLGQVLYLMDLWWVFKEVLGWICTNLVRAVIYDGGVVILYIAGDNVVRRYRNVMNRYGGWNMVVQECWMGALAVMLLLSLFAYLVMSFDLVYSCLRTFGTELAFAAGFFGYFEFLENYIRITY